MNARNLQGGVSVQEYYTKRFGQFGGDVRTLWNNQKSQEDRFHILAEVGALDGARVLDVGCGFGDFLDFLQAQTCGVQYTGIDAHPEILLEAKQRHAGHTFEQMDVLEFLPQTKFDFVFGSGIFGLKMVDQHGYVKDLLSHMFWLSEKGLAVNFLSSYTTGKKDKDSYHVEPQEVLSLALSITPRVVLRHDYRDNDFTLYLYPNPHATNQ